MGSLLSEHRAQDRDEMTKTAGLKDNYDAMMAVLPKVLEKAPVVLNAHILPKYNGISLLNPDFEIELNPRHYVVVTSDPEQIRDRRIRRNETTDRKSEVEDPAKIDFHQKLVVSTAETMARANRSELTVIYNSTDKTKGNVSVLRDIFTSI